MKQQKDLEGKALKLKIAKERQLFDAKKKQKLDTLDNEQVKQKYKVDLERIKFNC